MGNHDITRGKIRFQKYNFHLLAYCWKQNKNENSTRVTVNQNYFHLTSYIYYMFDGRAFIVAVIDVESGIGVSGSNLSRQHCIRHYATTPQIRPISSLL